MSLFTSGDNGTFDSTVDPNGNPPSDWNITKAVDSIVKFNNVNPITGTGSMHCESRTIFNDDYGFRLQADDAFDEDALQNATNGRIIPITQSKINLFDINTSFKINFDFRLTDLYDTGNQTIFSADLSGSGNTFLRLRISEQSTGYIPIINFFINGTGYSIALTNSISVGKKYNVNIEADYNNTLTIEFLDYDLVTTDSGSIALGANGGITLSSLVLGTPRFENYADINRPTRIVYQNLTIGTLTTVQYNLKFNQEQGIEVFETQTESFFNILNDYEDSELAFGGGAWVDTTTL